MNKPLESIRLHPAGHQHRAQSAEQQARIMDAQDIERNHPAGRAENMVHLTGLLHGKGRHVQGAFTKAHHQHFLACKDTEIPDLALGDDTALEGRLAGKFR